MLALHSTLAKLSSPSIMDSASSRLAIQMKLAIQFILQFSIDHLMPREIDQSRLSPKCFRVSAGMRCWMINIRAQKLNAVSSMLSLAGERLDRWNDGRGGLSDTAFW